MLEGAEAPVLQVPGKHPSFVGILGNARVCFKKHATAFKEML